MRPRWLRLSRKRGTERHPLRPARHDRGRPCGPRQRRTAAKNDFLRARLEGAPRAWDFLSIALSVVTADLAGRRSESADGWTREFDLTVAVADPAFWSTQAAGLETALKFLSTDRWRLTFVSGGLQPAPPREPVRPKEDCVVLLSGGLDSLIGAIDLARAGRKPFAVSNIVRGDGDNQWVFAAAIGGGLRHLALNHNATPPWGLPAGAVVDFHRLRCARRHVARGLPRRGRGPTLRLRERLHRD